MQNVEIALKKKMKNRNFVKHSCQNMIAMEMSKMVNKRH